MSQQRLVSTTCRSQASPRATASWLREAQARLAYLVDRQRGLGLVSGGTADDGPMLALWAADTFASRGHEVVCVSAASAGRGGLIDALAEGFRLAADESQPAWRAWQALHQHLAQNFSCGPTTVVIAHGVGDEDPSGMDDLLQLAHVGSVLDTRLILILICMPHHGPAVRRSFGNWIDLEIPLATSDV